MSRKTPSTKNVRNQVAIDAMIEGYQLATALKEPELKMGFQGEFGIFEEFKLPTVCNTK